MRTVPESEQDHVDRFVQELGDLPGVDLEVEGIVDRINGLRRRFHRMLDETLADFDLTEGEWRVLHHLWFAAPTYRRPVGKLAKRTDLSSGAMTNRLDRMEEAGLVRRLPDPDDRRGVLVELTEAGKKAWRDSVKAQGEKESLVATALNANEKRELNRLLRRLMLEFERRERS